MTATPPGWYDDGQGSLRWWDGSRWTEHVGARDAPAPETHAAVMAPDAAGSDAASRHADDAGAAPAPGDPVDPVAALGFGEASRAGAPGTDHAAAGYAAPGAPGPAAPYGMGAPAVGYPGSSTQDAPPKRSRWWIWAAAAGVVLIALIVLAVIFVPLALRAVLGGSGTGPSSSDEQAAVQAVEDYDRAWQSTDCELLVSVTTDDFREYYDLADCATFQDQASELADTTDDYRVEVTSVTSDEDGTVTVETTETYTSRIDEDGQDTGVEEPYSDDYTYLVVPSEGAWLIDDAAIE